MTYPRTPGVLELPRMTAGRYTPMKSSVADLSIAKCPIVRNDSISCCCTADFEDT